MNVCCRLPREVTSPPRQNRKRVRIYHSNIRSAVTLSKTAIWVNVKMMWIQKAQLHKAEYLRTTAHSTPALYRKTVYVLRVRTILHRYRKQKELTLHSEKVLTLPKDF